MAVRGIMTINAPDGALIATITHDADTADQILRQTIDLVYRPSQPLTTMQMFLHLNEAYALENGNDFRNMGTEWLTNPMYFARDEGSHVPRAHVKNLLEMGFTEGRWSVNTETGRFVRLGTTSERRSAQKCTCRGR